MWLNGDEDQGPVPFGLAIADMLAGAAAAQGILAALVRRGVTGKGGHVETSLLEALVDFQFEVLTTHLNDGRRLPRRSNFRSAHAYLSAPYGVYPAQDGFLAHRHDADRQARRPARAGAELAPYRRQAGDLVHRARRDQGDHRAARSPRRPVDEWLAVLEPADIWCAKVLTWPELMDSDGLHRCSTCCRR